MRKRGENTIMTFTPALKNRKTGKKEGMDKNPPLLPYDKKGTKKQRHYFTRTGRIGSP